jgi:DNA-binding transcriptional ArsR family regulator
MPEEPFVLVSLKEEKAKKLTQTLSNSTSRKILDLLSNKEYTESELSKELKQPMSTIHYNLKQLMEVGLIVVDEFHYSKKGREVNHYKLANKMVIITPKEVPANFMDKLKKILPVAVLAAGGAVLLKITNLARFGTEMIRSPIQTLGESKAAPMMADVDMMEEAGDFGLAETVRTVEDTVEEEAMDLVVTASEPVVEDVPHIIEEVTIINHLTFYDAMFWILIGVAVTLFVYLLISYIRSKMK